MRDVHTDDLIRQRLIDNYLSMAECAFRIHRTIIFSKEKVWLQICCLMFWKWWDITFQKRYIL